MPSELLVCGNTLSLQGKTYSTAIGRDGLIAADKKREGDGCTPVGTWALRECWYRADRMDAPKTALPLRIITQNDGWCDDPNHAEYNRHVKLPFAAHHEKLWLEDTVYDLVIPLGYNDDPAIPGKGSAIFLHIARHDYSPTEGCVAMSKADLLSLLPGLGIGSTICIGQK